MKYFFKKHVFKFYNCLLFISLLFICVAHHAQAQGSSAIKLQPTPYLSKYYWVIYDTVCPYCKEATKHIKQLDWEKKFKFVSYRSSKTYKMFPFLKREECEKDVHMVTPKGEVLIGYEVFKAIIDNLTATKILNPILKNDYAEKKLQEIYEKMVKERTCYYDKSGACDIKGKHKTNQNDKTRP